MLYRMIAFALTVFGAFAIVSSEAHAQKFPPYLNSCKKERQFEQVNAEHIVPTVGGGRGTVRVVSQRYSCKNKTTGNNQLHALYGMKDASGKLVIPYAYAGVLPFSTTGAVVSEYGPTTYVTVNGYRTYIVGKGESKERFTDTPWMLQANDGCRTAPGDASPRTPTVVVSVDVYRDGGGKANLKVFLPDGGTRVLKAMGGDGLTDPIRRVGDVLLVRWRDEQGRTRSGILDLQGRPITPVLTNTALWVTPTEDPYLNSVSGCSPVSYDLFIEGPSLDPNPEKPFFGPLLFPVGRDGQPVPLPKGALGMFPVYKRRNNSPFSDAIRDLTSVWAVVFPKGNGFEFTMHQGAPAEALIAAEFEPRYGSLALSGSYGGLVTAQRASDGKWTTFRAQTLVPIGSDDADYTRNFQGAVAILEKQSIARQQQLAAENAQREADRLATHKRNWQTARSTGRLCQVQINATNTRQDFDDYLAACGANNFQGFASLALAKGITPAELEAAANAHATAQALRQMEVAKARAKWEEDQRLVRMQTANKSPSASYYPGQWESTIRNAGNTAADAINESSENWLLERRKQYIADWQRSQRAY